MVEPRLTVTPVMARAWLQTSRQTAINLQRVLLYAGKMQEGRWQEKAGSKAKPLKFDDAGRRLINGHHRLLAIILTGAPVTFDIVGTPPPVHED